MSVDALHCRVGLAGTRPGCASGSRATPEINNFLHSGQVRQRRHDVVNEQKVERAVKEPEGRTFSGSAERRTVGKLAATFDIRRRERPQRSRDFSKCEIGKMPRL